MPYITKEKRIKIAREMNLDIFTHAMKNLNNEFNLPGHLNYIIVQLCLDYITACSGSGNQPTYGLLNEVIGALESAKLEFYRRKIVPFEIKKIKENGDLAW